MIHLLLDKLKDMYVKENFKKVQEHLNRPTRATSHTSYTDATRPLSGLYPGDTIFNISDNQLNVWTGSQWTLTDGTPT